MISRIQKTRICRGFTLIELLIVIVIIMLLATIAMVAMGPILDHVDRVRCGAQLSAVLTSYLAYTNQYSKYFPPLNNPKEYKFKEREYDKSPSVSNPFDNYFITSKNAYFSAGFGPLVAHGMIKSEYFVCPSVADTEENWWRLTPVAKAEYWWQSKANPNPENAWRERKNITNPSFASYSIRHRLYPWTPSQVATAQAKESDVHIDPSVGNLIAKHGRRAILADNLSTKTMVYERHETGVNVAYIDGSVSFVGSNVFMEQLEDMGTNESRLDILWYVLDSGKTPDD
jgi:prepilin-type N-terminal cleavage/methylation domain-containing protein/prepilin-type processing-associated H-X9-DG protein